MHPTIIQTPYQVSPLWLGLKVTDKPGPEYNADWLTMLTMLVLWPVLAHTRPHRSLLGHDTGETFWRHCDLRYLNTIQSNIHEQWRAVSRYSTNHVTLVRRLFTARLDHFTPHFIKTVCSLQIISSHSLLNLVCRVPANKCTGWCLTNKIHVT